MENVKILSVIIVWQMKNILKYDWSDFMEFKYEMIIISKWYLYIYLVKIVNYTITLNLS